MHEAWRRDTPALLWAFGLVIESDMRFGARFRGGSGIKIRSRMEAKISDGAGSIESRSYLLRKCNIKCKKLLNLPSYREY